MCDTTRSAIKVASTSTCMCKSFGTCEDVLHSHGNASFFFFCVYPMLCLLYLQRTAGTFCRKTERAHTRKHLKLHACCDLLAPQDVYGITSSFTTSLLSGRVSDHRLLALYLCEGRMGMET